MTNAKCRRQDRTKADIKRLSDFAFFILHMVFGLAFLASLANADEPTWKAGAAKAIITPTEPVWMAGYAGRKGPSEGVLLDLHAKALAITDAEHHRLVIVTLDLISIPQALRDSLLAQAEK